MHRRHCAAGGCARRSSRRQIGDSISASVVFGTAVTRRSPRSPPRASDGVPSRPSSRRVGRRRLLRSGRHPSPSAPRRLRETVPSASPPNWRPGAGSLRVRSIRWIPSCCLPQALCVFSGGWPADLPSYPHPVMLAVDRSELRTAPWTSPWGQSVSCAGRDASASLAGARLSTTGPPRSSWCWRPRRKKTPWARGACGRLAIPGSGLPPTQAP